MKRKCFIFPGRIAPCPDCVNPLCIVDDDPPDYSTELATRSLKNIREESRTNDLKYARAFGFFESAVHRALRELEKSHFNSKEARAILHDALRELAFNHGIELHWPDDVKEIKFNG